MSSRVSELERSTASGDALEYVSDHADIWRDAQPMAVLEQRREIAETLSTRAVTFEVTTEILVEIEF